jgi:hypothetical protein
MVTNLSTPPVSLKYNGSCDADESITYEKYFLERVEPHRIKENYLMKAQQNVIFVVTRAALPVSTNIYRRLFFSPAALVNRFA